MLECETDFVCSEYEAEHGCFFRGGGGGGSMPAQQNVTQKTEPWEGQKPFLEDVYKKAQAAYAATPQQSFTGQLVARPTPLQLQARADTLSLAENPAIGRVGQDVVSLAERTARGDMLMPGSNPFLQSNIEAAFTPVVNTFTRQIVPQISRQADLEGAYGGSGHDLALSDATDNLTRNLLDQASRIGYENYLRERSLQLQAPALLSAGLGASSIPARLKSAVGSEEQISEQDVLNEAYQQYLFGQAEPWIGLPEYSGIVTSGFPGSSTTGTMLNTPFGGPSRFSNIISGALGGAGLGALAGTTLGGLESSALLSSAGAPWLLGGAVLGGLLGVF